MAALPQENSPELQLWKQQKMVRVPNLKPKTALGQKTVYINSGVEVEKQFQELKSEYYNTPSTLQPFLKIVKDRILTNIQILNAPSGIYTWILKNGKIHATLLRTNQEIGSLHTNIDVLSITNQNHAMGNSRPKPEAAGEMLILNDGENINILYNLQSGTFSEPTFTCRAKALAEERGITNKKQLREQMASLKISCRQPFIDEIQPKIESAIGITRDRIRFLDCHPDIDTILGSIPFLQGVFDNTPCKDDDGYFESIAGKNLIRRLKLYTSPQNITNLNKYYTTEKRPTKKRGSNTISKIALNGSINTTQNTTKKSKTAASGNIKTGGYRRKQKGKRTIRKRRI